VLRGACFHAGVVDRPGDNVSSPHHQRTERGDRCAYTTGCTDSHRRGILMEGLHVVSLCNDRRKQAHQRTVIRVSTGVCLNGDIVSHRDVRSQRCLAVRDQPLLDQRTKQLGRRRVKKLRRNFAP